MGRAQGHLRERQISDGLSEILVDHQRRRVEIRAPGKLYGNISTPSLIIHDGVLFEGKCAMGGDNTRAEKKPPLLPLPKGKNGAPPNGNLKVESEGDWG